MKLADSAHRAGQRPSARDGIVDLRCRNAAVEPAADEHPAVRQQGWLWPSATVVAPVSDQVPERRIVNLRSGRCDTVQVVTPSDDYATVGQKRGRVVVTGCAPSSP